ncbi:sigma-54-dependent Fis family transcriptional regulator [Gelria sp. Kuro-4]|uniref:sigma-54 interaction domain-containing protein n=1 Tax=Gelria sp. Kuro-4 TaxID=2796927 RepID=UPI001BF0B1AD|nr:sigma 54-interacting transcriptional regulator [Gelria sp. Kuro-4]BCV25699.1 RNA polymerase subunit sigma-54 [Gelria sp. Kuro-4]
MVIKEDILGKDTLIQILDYFPDGIAVTDAQGNYLLVNRAYETLAGIKAEEVIGRNVQFLLDQGYISPPSVSQLIQKTKRSISSMQKFKRTGRELLITGNPLFNKQGDLVLIIATLRDMTELNHLKQELEKRSRESEVYQAELDILRRQQKVEKVIYRSKVMSHVIELVKRVAPFDTTILLTGESGVGKEVMARLIHDLSPRAAEPFVEVNCAAIPPELIEAELFGYEEGAFTGARKQGKPGLFEVAHKGTLFLDEVAELAPKTQADLLRVLQDKKVRRVGGTSTFEVNTRVIAATNKNLADQVQKGAFREDLYYRLNVVPITIPPLRQRKEDITPLVAHFVAKCNAKYGLNKSISPEVLQSFFHYDWPGNVRELEHTVERLLLTSTSSEVTLSSLAQQNPGGITSFEFLSLQGYLDSMERRLLENLYSSLGSTRKLAQVLQVDQSTVVRKLQKYGITKQDRAKHNPAND